MSGHTERVGGATRGRARSRTLRAKLQHSRGFTIQPLPVLQRASSTQEAGAASASSMAGALSLNLTFDSVRGNWKEQYLYWKDILSSVYLPGQREGSEVSPPVFDGQVVHQSAHLSFKKCVRPSVPRQRATRETEAAVGGEKRGAGLGMSSVAVARGRSQRSPRTPRQVHYVCPLIREQ